MAIPKGTIQFAEYFKCRRTIKNISSRSWTKVADQQVASLVLCLPSFWGRKEGVFHPPTFVVAPN